MAAGEMCDASACGERIHGFGGFSTRAREDETRDAGGEPPTRARDDDARETM